MIIVTQLDNYRDLDVTGVADSIHGVRQVIQRSLDESREYSLEKDTLSDREVVPNLSGRHMYESSSFHVVFTWKVYELNT
jgi:hypothetical protein